MLLNDGLICRQAAPLTSDLQLSDIKTLRERSPTSRCSCITSHVFFATLKGNVNHNVTHISKSNGVTCNDHLTLIVRPASEEGWTDADVALGPADPVFCDSVKGVATMFPPV